MPGDRAHRAWASIDIAAAPGLAASLGLLALCLLAYLPGALRLPAVDRTEVIFAETTRDMVARGAWTDPRYGETIQQFRPIGTFWAQGVAAAATGPENARDIRVYRLPGVIAVTLAVLALYWLTVPLVGATTALIAAALFAVAPLTVLVSQLAIAEGLSLLPATVAMLALLRLYVSEDDRRSPWLALLFWAALGAAMLINALMIPILVAATLIALYAFDRDLTWLKATRPLIGVPLALAIASPWIIVRAHQDGAPFAGMAWGEFIEALGGSQDMKLRAFPGTFVLALLLGFLPGTALLAPAARRLWLGRDQRLARFLLAWVLGYLIYLELLSSKPGTYTVQAMFPALALGVATLVSAHKDGTPPPKWYAIPWAALAALFVIAVFAVVYGANSTTPSLIAAALIAAVAALFFTSAAEGRAGRLTRWAATSAAAFGVFAATLLGAVLPDIEKLWPAQLLQRTIAAACPAAANARLGAVGFREPSGIFTLGLPHATQSTDALFDADPQIAIVESRWLNRYFVANAARGQGQNVGTPLGCVSALNVMRGCPLSFAIYQRDPALACAPQTSTAKCQTAENLPALKKACD
ncbi:MAG: ArnT family glycosyltransferase [Hyphomicrobium sp.]